MVEQHFNPFPGLRPFEEDEEHLFFGRENQIDQLSSKLIQYHFLAVIGASGSGKSLSTQAVRTGRRRSSPAIGKTLKEQ